ncbi:hypothetical protein EJ03DRAFT_377696 [Teratosphaeria nubilosa]|uniref:Uncharacterized protein n=1 Tax=Teratosphaeria nubilosa TaxID=161662 RepID=A0A6G1KZL3_9PEZI|nr:hypothetical protein EJ03DRAFT_377696 [Teratosphaeria nubilosa]
MASRRLLLTSALARAPAPTLPLRPRSFQTSSKLYADDAAPIAATTKRPVGAFRGTVFGFLLGTALAGGGLYYYVIDEYKVSNELLTEDIYALQSAVQRLEGYVKGLEEKVKTGGK